MASITALSKQTLKLVSQYISLMKNQDEILRLSQHVNNSVRLVRRAIRKRVYDDNPNENAHSLEANLSLLKYYALKLKNQYKNSVKKGSGLSNDTPKLVWQDVESGFNNRLRTGLITNINIKDPREFFKKAFRSFSAKIKTDVKKSMLKVNVTFYAKFIKPQTGEEDVKSFGTRNAPIDATTNISDWYRDNVTDKILTKLEEFAEKDSGWALLEIIGLKVHINCFQPLKGGYNTGIKLPKFIGNKHAVINVQNKDEFCLLWAIVSALHPAKKDPQRTSSYPHFSRILKYDNIKFPIKIDDVHKIEVLNNIRINLYCLDGPKILPCSLSKLPMESGKTINLLMLPINSAKDGEDIMYHFMWIKNMSALFHKQISLKKNKKYICERCLNHFGRADLLQDHLKSCSPMNDSAIKLPAESRKILEFKNFNFQETVPFVIYVDTESILKRCPQPEFPNKTTIYQEHQTFSVAYYLKCSYDDSLSLFKSRRGPDCIEWFIKELEQIAISYSGIIKSNKPMELTSGEVSQFDNSTCCHICQKEFLPQDVKVRDHDHKTGKFRGAAHQACNLNYQDSHFLPIIAHNMSGYDAHFFIKELASSFEGRVTLLPINKERYISFSKQVHNTNVTLRFIDSFRFMPSSVEKLASFLDEDQKSITKSYCNSDDEFKLLTRKGVFPYDYLDCWDKLRDESLPSKEQFYSELRDENISDSDYQHAMLVWNTFNIQTLGDFADLYLKTDVLLLADIFENYRKTCVKTYQLDPLHYYTAPGLAFDAMLKTTGVRLELLTDINQLLFIERGIRGGVSQCSNRYAKANNEFMGHEYDPSQETNFLMYFDVNNLYGHAMSQSLPFGEFEFLENFVESDIINTPDDSDYGYIVECDLEYPTELHDLHSDLPLGPEHMIPPNQTSKYKKLLLTLYDKKNYIVHYRNLKMYLEFGMRLKCIHKVLQFRQSCWLKTYIDLNTSLRQQSKNEFEKNYYKLMNNCVFGKCMQNVRKHKDIRLVTKWEGRWGVQSLVAKPNFHSSIIFEEDMAIIEMNKLEITMNKPIYVGMAILDISKTFIYEFHYNYMLKRCQPQNVKLLYTDTDSLIYSFISENIYDIMKIDLHRFDTSDYEPENPYGIPLVNKKVPGLMKDENNGCIMREFIGLRSKMYALLVDNSKTPLIRKSKGVCYSALKHITFDDYKACLFSRQVLEKTQNYIRSKKHTVFTVRQEKIALSPYDDKRILSFPDTDTRPWGYLAGRPSTSDDEDQMFPS